MKASYYDPGMYGTENYWKYPYSDLIYVDSVRNFCQEKEAYWLLDVVASYWPKLRNHGFLLITLDVKDGQAMFTVKEDTGKPNIVSQFIEFTDLDVSIQLYLENNVLIFPSDH